MTDKDFKSLIEEFGSKNLELLKQKGAYPYAYMDSFKTFSEEKLPDRKRSYRSLKNGKTDDNHEKFDNHISHEKYLTCKKVWDEKYGWLSQLLVNKRCTVISWKVYWHMLKILWV